MDAEWVNRWGILAEAISFLLIAPEIIGAERLGRFETALEEFLGRASQWPRTSLVPTRYSRFIPARAVKASNPLGALTDGISFAAVAIGAGLALRFTVGPRLGVLFMVGVVQAVLLAILGVVLLGPPRPARLMAAIGQALTIPAAPVLWPAAGLSAAVETLLLALIRMATRLLEGPGRLRVLVFGTGIVLLFGGMGAQFVATF